MMYLKNENIKQNQFCEEIDYSASGFSHFIIGKTEFPRIDLLIKTMKRFPTWNIRWLLLGEGDMYYKENEITVIQEPEKGYGNMEIIKSLTDQLAFMREELDKRNNEIKSLLEQLRQIK